MNILIDFQREMDLKTKFYGLFRMSGMCPWNDHSFGQLITYFILCISYAYSFVVVS